MDKISELATKYTNKAAQQPVRDKIGPVVVMDIDWLHGCFQEMGEEIMNYKGNLFNHLAFSINHGTFDPFTPGGCSCDFCTELRAECKLQREREAPEIFTPR